MHGGAGGGRRALGGAAIPAPGHLEQLVAPAQGVDQLKLRRVQSIKPVQDIRRLADHQAKVGEIERDVLEPEQRTAVQLMALHDVGVEFERRERHAALDAPLQLQQLDVHVHGARELGMACLDRAQFCNLRGIRSAESGRGDRARPDHTQPWARAMPPVQTVRDTG